MRKLTVVLRYLLDTNLVSEPTKPAASPAVLQALAQHEVGCTTSAPTLEQLTFGCARLPAGARQAWLQRWLAGLVSCITVLPFDQQAAIWLGQERARLALAGRPVPRTDGEIAAVAVVQGLTLVTRNSSDFAAFKGLLVVDWQVPAPPSPA